jgi:hypothetical protein
VDVEADEQGLTGIVDLSRCYPTILHVEAMKL